MSKWNRQTHGEKTREDSLCRSPIKAHEGLINSIWKVTFIWKVTSKLSKYTNVYQSYREVLQAESSKPYESNLNNISDMKNSEATKQPLLPDTSTCVADHNDELSKDSVIDYVRKTDNKSVPISCDRARAGNSEPSRIPYKKTSSLFHKDKA